MKIFKIILGVVILILFLGGAYLIAVNYPNTNTAQNPVGGVAPNPAPIVTPPVATPKPKPTPTPVPKPSPSPVPTPTPTPVPTPAPVPTVKSYTLAEVALHNNAQNCWTAISGNVYNVTSFISQHPGGSQAILSLCGIDGTAIFLNQHSGQNRPQNELQSFFIGTLR